MERKSDNKETAEYIIKRLRTCESHVKTNNGMLKNHYNILTYHDEYDDVDVALANRIISDLETSNRAYKKEIEKWKNHKSQKIWESRR